MIYKCFEILDSLIYFGYFEDFQGVWLVYKCLFIGIIIDISEMD